MVRTTIEPLAEGLPHRPCSMHLLGVPPPATYVVKKGDAEMYVCDSHANFLRTHYPQRPNLRVIKGGKE